MYLLDLKKDYARYNNILYEDGNPIIKFTVSNFCDLGPERAMKSYLGLQGVKYMQAYMNMWPNYWEIYKEPNVLKGTIFEYIIPSVVQEKIVHKDLVRDKIKNSNTL